MKSRVLIISTISIILACFYFLYSFKSFHYTSNNSPINSDATDKGHVGLSTTSLPNDIANPQSKQLIEKSECKKLYSNSETIEELTLNKNYALSKFIRSLETKGFNTQQIEVIGDIAGIGKKEISLASIGLNTSEFMSNQGKIVLLADEYQTRTDMPSENRDYFDNLVTQKDYVKLIQAAQEKRINPNDIRFGASLLSYIIQSNNDISSSDIDNLLDAGFPINLDAIVNAIKKDVQTQIVITLSERYTQKNLGTWQEDGNDMNLSLASAKALRPDLMQYFIKKGVNGFTQSYSGVNTILDELPKPKNEKESKIALEIANEVLSHGGAPTRYSSLERLNSWLPEPQKQQYKSLLHVRNDINDEQLKIATELKSILDTYNKKAAYSSDAISRCKAQHNYDTDAYIEELVKEKPSSIKLSLNDKKNITTYLKKQQQEFFKNPEGFLKRLKNTAQNITITKNPPELISLYKSLNAATMDKQWAKALEISEKLNIASGNKAGYTSLLSSYLWEENPSWGFIEDLLQRGTPIDSGLMMPLARKGHVEFTEKLLAYGLNPSGLNDLGENALSFAVVARKNERMISFLIEHGVTVKPDTLGLDPLDIALGELDSYSDMKEAGTNTPYFATPAHIAILIKAGAPLERSHIEKIELLQEINPKAFNALINTYPELLSHLKH